MIHYLGTLTDPSAPNNDCTTDIESDGNYLTLWFASNDGSPWTSDGISLSLLEVRQLQIAIDAHLDLVYSDHAAVAERSRAAIARQ